MLQESNEVKRFLGLKFGYGEQVPDGVYAVPTETTKGPAFMKIELKGGVSHGKANFTLFWDEALQLDWYGTDRPEELKDSEFAIAYRKVLTLI